MFTTGQLVILIIITEMLIYAFLSKCLDVIKHCSTAKTYRKAMEKDMLTPYEFKKLCEMGYKYKEENKNECGK